MSDFELRRLDRKFAESGAYEDAIRLIAALKRATNFHPGDDSRFVDMHICSFWLGELPGIDDGFDQTEEYQSLTAWIERNASFSYVKHDFNWEYMLYIGFIDEETDIAACFTVNYEIDPTPSILIPIIREALSQGIRYISFHAEG